MYIVLQNFTKPADTTKEEIFASILPELLAYRRKLKPFAWARIETFFGNFRYLGDFLPKETIIDTIIPLLKKQLTDVRARAAWPERILLRVRTR
jgi:hypothetical protein